MKIESGRGVTSTNGARRASGAGGSGGFTPAVDEPQRASAASAAGPVTSLDAILALQAEEGPLERRKRQARRGRAALDALEKLSQGLLLGRAPGALAGEMERLRGGSEPTGEAELDGVLREIDTRLAVELAKLEKMRGRN